MAEQGPELVRRRENRKSTIRAGRTIGEKRERLETANERAAARKKVKAKKALRIFVTTLGFAGLAAILILIGLNFFRPGEPSVTTFSQDDTNTPTTEIIDEDSTAGGQITTRMRTYIAQAEQDLRDLGYTPTKVVIPTNTIREVDFYLEGYPGFIKMITDRDSAVSAEDASRMLHYLAEQGITDFIYIDVRIDGKAYWK